MHLIFSTIQRVSIILFAADRSQEHLVSLPIARILILLGLLGLARYELNERAGLCLDLLQIMIRQTLWNGSFLRHLQDLYSKQRLVSF